MNFFEAFILGLVQGLTEFLPVSSSGHLELGTAILGIKVSDNLLFAVIVHAATALSTITIFRNDIAVLIKETLLFKWNESTKYAFKLAISMIPVGIVGLFFENELNQFFGGKVMFVGSMLIVTSMLLAFTYLNKSHTRKISYTSAFIIGLAQAVAILPGISRSGATIATALLLKTDKDESTRFSFLMVLVPILGATALKFKDYLGNPTASDEIPALSLLIGFIAAFISGLLACRWMIAVVKKGKLIYFAVYCFIIGTIAIISQLH
ncbi:MAG: undecaprenyl-diphosphate phosphatase [Bacteroidetes bacterium]|nr:undecaprenyl-diphosphate phosphatase [Bacteroidota bacterium]